MLNHTRNTRLQALFQACNATKHTGLMVVREGSTQGITDVIREGCNARHLWNSCLHRQLLMWISTCASTPSLAIYKYLWVDSIEFTTNIIHRLNVMHTHKVYTETVNMIFIYPILHRFQHILAHQRALTCCLITTPCAI